MVSKPCPYECVRFCKHHGSAGYCCPLHMKRTFNLLGEQLLVQTLRGYSARAIRTAGEGTAVRI